MTNVRTRIINKHDLEAVWLSTPDFIPMQGELVIYDCEVDANGETLALPDGRTTPYTYERFKIGDGKTYVNDLPFACSYDGSAGEGDVDVSAQLAAHNTDTTAHSDIRLSIDTINTRLNNHEDVIDNSVMIDKSFGNGPDTIAEGNHIHSDLQLQMQSIEEVINAGYYDTSDSVDFFTEVTPSHTVWSASSSSKVTGVDIIGGRYVCTTSTVDHGLKTETLTDLMEVVRGKTIVAAANLSSDNYTLYIKMHDGTAWSFGKIKSTDKIVTVDVPENITQFKFGLEYKGDGSTPETCEMTNFALYLVNDVAITSTANIPNRNYTIWSWDDEEILDPNSFASFCNAYKINRVYQHISTSTLDLEAIRNFVGTMQKNRISVNWLTGDPSWSLADHHYHITEQFQKVVSYNMSIQNDYEKIGTIQFDIEPYALDEWNTDQASVIKQYQDAVVLMYNESLAKQLSLNVCVASWFDGVAYDNEYGQGNLFDFVSKHSSSTVIMAYNTKSYVSIAEDEIRMGALNGKNVAVGLETHVVDDSVTEDITFANKPIEDLYRAFETLFLVYKIYGVYKGYEFVIHDYSYFKAYADSFNLTVTSNDILGKLTTENKTDLISAINEINTEVESLKTSVSEGKALIASAVTDKGVQTAGDATFATIAANIQSISSGGESINIDAEISTQESTIASQDTLIANIMSALEGKAAGGGSGVSLVTTTITDEQLEEWPNELTIPELIGAKYFIIQGNPLTNSQMAKTNYVDDASTIYQLVYLDGIKISTTYMRPGTISVNWVVPITSTDPSEFTFDETTGTISANDWFCRPSTDTTENTVYTVYALK